LLDSGGREKFIIGTDLGHQNERFFYQIISFDEGISY
jgi:hypothetical protein